MVDEGSEDDLPLLLRFCFFATDGVTSGDEDGVDGAGEEATEGEDDGEEAGAAALVTEPFLSSIADALRFFDDMTGMGRI